MKKLLFTLSLFSFLFIFSSSCNGKKVHPEKRITIYGKVIHIVDGDTYDLLTDDKKTFRIRMDGIDAPERSMAFYKVSKNYLGELCMNKTLKVVKTDTDQYGRVVAFSFLKNGKELGQEMIIAGMAWHFKKYNTDNKLAKLEIEARKARQGLWKDPKPVPPWEYRKFKKQNMKKNINSL